MATKDLHEKPFDSGTLAKLAIFEDYAEAWIPTFVMQARSKICIFDFFAGTGYDKAGVPGSPMRILDKLHQQIKNILGQGVTVNVILNEFEPGKKLQRKFQLLQEAVNGYLSKNQDLARVVNVDFYNEDCSTLFPKLLPEMRDNPSLVYLDQNGIKFLADQYLLELEKMNETDFLYFVSSSYVWRLGETPEFVSAVPFDVDELKHNPYRYIHRSIIDQLRKKLPETTKLKLYPFSIKKASNIHGIIFGATHPLAVDKFLNISWRANRLNGEADFDIDEDQKKCQIELFGNQKLTKVESFQENVRKKILSKEISNNFELLQFVYAEGHIGAHAATVLRRLKRNGEIDYSGTSPLVTYENVYKLRKLLTYKVVGEKVLITN